MNIRIILGILLIASATLAFADDRELPASWSLDEPASLQLNRLFTAEYPALDLEALAFEDSLNEAAGEPPRFAFPHAARFNLHSDGDWDMSGDTSIWRMRVRAEGAVLLNFGFSNLFLPDGAALYIYTASAAEKHTMDRFQVIGPYTSSINRDHGEFWTPNLHADDVVIEVNVPAGQRERVQFEISQVSHGYRGFGAAATEYRQPADRLEGDGKQSCKDEGGARSGACNMDVACLDDDDPWSDPRRSVGAYQRSGVFACTGSLVNNTANDQRMLFMTATHCINSGQAPSIVVYWNYEWPSCRRPGASGGTDTNPPDPNMSNSGGTWLAATINPFGGGGCTDGSQCSDMTVIELDDPADPDFDLFWSGWDRRPPPTACAQGAPNTTDGLCATIHHPGVDEKRITFVEEDIQVGNIAAATGVHWHPFWHPNPPELPNMPPGGTVTPGVTEGGSSGSPLYTADQRFIGVLSGGPAACGATGSNLSDFYGQLAHAWDGLGTPTTRMRDYLDPLATNPEFIDGIGTDGFEIVPEDTEFSQCGFADLDIAIDVNEVGDFSDSVMLSVTGLPAGVTDSFTNNNQAPSFSTVLTLGNLAAAGEGGFTFTVDGLAGDQDFSVDIDVSLFDGAPAVPGLTSPSDGAMDVGLQPEFTWDAVSGAAEYQIQVATDAGFGTVVIDEFVTGTSFIPASELATGTDYFWRVRGTNTCGDGDWSAEFSFTTRLEPVADVTPESFTFEVPQGGTDSDTLFVTNSGTGSLVWDIHESETAARGGAVLLEQDFEGAFPPAGWDTADNGSVPCPWLRSDSYPLPDLVASSLGAAIDSDECGVDGIPAESIDSELLAPALDLSGMAGTEISFDVAYRHFGSARMDFQVSGDGGDTWDTLATWDCCNTTPINPATETFDLSAYDGLGDVRLRWHFVSGWDWWGFVDNVAVTAEAVACDTPTDIAWLNASPDNGSTDAGMTDEVTVAVDAAGMEEGQYEANLCMTTNAEGQGLITLPVELTVTSVPAPVAAISPENFDFEIMAGGTDGDVLNVGNTGDADLEWSFTDSAPAECAWDTTLGNPGGSLNALGLWGGTLYVGGSANTNFNGVTAGVAEVDLDTATVMPLGTTELVDGFVTSLLPYDDGSGERLYIAGSFNGIRFDGAELPDSRGVVAWDGSETATLDGSPFAEPLVFAQAATVYDGQLVIGGAGGAIDPPQRPVLTFWDGTDWTVFREEFDGLVAPVILAVEAFDGDLYFAGRFASIEYPESNVVESLNIMGFDGENFFSVGGGLERSTSIISQVLAMKTFDDGNGEALYIGGRFDTAVDSQESMFAVAKWDGTELSAVGNGFPMPNEVRGFEVYDDGNGPALYAVGNYTEDTVGTPISRVAKLEGGEWVEVAGGAGENPNRALSLPAGSLSFAGNFSDVGGVSGVPGSGPSNGFAQLVCEIEVACDDIGQIPWLDAAPDAGTTAPGGNVPADIMVDTGGLAAGDYEALLCVATNDPAAAIVEVPVTLTVIPEPGELEVSPAAVDFGGVVVGGTGMAMVTVSNAAEEGAAELELTQIEIIAGQGVFAIDAAGSDCGETLAPQTSCAVAMNYSPNAAAAHNGILRIAAEGKGTVNVDLSGNGVEPEPTIFEDRFEVE